MSAMYMQYMQYMQRLSLTISESAEALLIFRMISASNIGPKAKGL